MADTSLKAQFDALQAERERTWAPEQLRRNAGTREDLVRKYDPRNHVQVGELVEPFTLVDGAGKEISRDDLLRHGPAVLIFYRYGGCPACNIALPHYDRNLTQRLRAQGITLIAISPQTPVDPALAPRHGLELLLASDPGNALGRRLGITFEPEDKPAVKPGDSWIGSLTGTGTWELPQPTVVVLDQDASVRFVDVSPDWLARTEVGTILDALPELRAAAA